MSYLLDTCTISKLRKLKKYPDKKLEKWVLSHNESTHFISVITIGEIQAGISKLDLKKPAERQKRLLLEDWLFGELIPRFNDRTVTINAEVTVAWGKMYGECQRRGVIVPVVDGLIAATAMVHNLTVVTENVTDFLETGARLLNPWAN